MRPASLLLLAALLLPALGVTSAGETYNPAQRGLEPSDPHDWVPTLNFDGAAGDYFYPDEPSAEGEISEVQPKKVEMPPMASTSSRRLEYAPMALATGGTGGFRPGL
jgi:hypothetical protein